MTRPNLSADPRDREPLHPGGQRARPDYNAVWLEWTRRQLRHRADGVDDDDGGFEPPEPMHQLELIEGERK